MLKDLVVFLPRTTISVHFLHRANLVYSATETNSHTGDCHTGWSFLRFLLHDEPKVEVDLDTDSVERTELDDDGGDGDDRDDGKGAAISSKHQVQSMTPKM